jgi:hypothetical protein
MISRKRPRVISVNGKVRNTSMGRTIRFKTPSTAAAAIAAEKLETWTPSTRWGIINIVKLIASQRISIPIRGVLYRF